MSKHKTVRKTSKEVNTAKDISPKVYQNDKIDFMLNVIQRYELTENQKRLVEIIEDKHTRAVFVQGPAGTSKTYTALFAALNLMNKKSISDIIYVRSIIESASKSLGSLPGEADDKLAPFLLPLHDKLEELLPKSQVSQLVKEERIKGIPVNYLRGASIAAKVVIADESQNYSTGELITILTRIGKFSKFIFLGDPFQSDIGKHSGFNKMFDMFNDEESRAQGIHCFSFTREDIVRSGVLKYIIEKIENDKIRNTVEPHHNPTVLLRDEPMFK